MQSVGTVESLWRYPVKSMRGETMQQLFAGFAGVFGDRAYAIHSTAAPKGFPYLTGREQEQMLRYRPIWRHPEAMTMPPNYLDAEALSPGLTPVYGEMDLDVESPTGKRFAIDDPILLEDLRQGLRDRHQLSLLRSDRALTDCRPLSLFSLQTVRQLSEEVGVALDKRRFRANLYIDLTSGKGFDEDWLVGRTLRIGPKVIIAVLDRDPRCKMITLDPDTGNANPDIIKCLARDHESKAGVYAAVLVEGLISLGDEITVVS